MNQSELSPARRVFSVVWALMPAYTFGILAPAPFIHAAMRLRTLRLWLIATAYGVVWIMCMLLIGTRPAGSSGNSVAENLGVALAIALAVIGTIHAFQLRRSVFAMRAGRREGLPPSPPAPAMFAEPQPDDVAATCSSLRTTLAALTSYVREHNDAFPPACQQLIAEIIDYSQRVITHADDDRTAEPQLRSVQAILADYLPGSINSYVRLPKDFATTQVNAEGRTSADELELQLRLLRDATREAVDSISRGDATRLREQSAFLRGKFQKSELDLP